MTMNEIPEFKRIYNNAAKVTEKELTKAVKKTALQLTNNTNEMNNATVLGMIAALSRILNAHLDMYEFSSPKEGSQTRRTVVERIMARNVK